MTLAATERFGRNLTALMESQPSVATLVEAAPVPDGVTLVTGRDGLDTFKVPAESGLPVWFGGSSMPSISAAEMFAGGGGGGGNMALPGVLTGNEPLVLLGRLFPHEMLFVLEESPLAIRLAMHLYDYADLIASGRLVFLLTADLVESMTTFFAAHPGCLLPARLLTVAQRSASQTADLQRRLEHAGAFGAAEQNLRVDSYVQALGGREVGRVPERPRVAVLGVDARSASLEQADRISRALEQLHWEHEVCVPNSPDKCHLAARLAAVDRARADFVLIINAAAGSLRSKLPPNMPVASWYLPGTGVEPTAGGELHERQLVFASSKALLDAVVRCGVAEEVAAICPLAADDAMYRPLPDQPGMPTDTDTPRGLKPAARPAIRRRRCDDLTLRGCENPNSHSQAGWCENPFSHPQVSVLMDLPDIGPEAAGVTLASHITLWHAMEEAVLQNVDRYRGELAEELLDIAQRVSGTTLQEAPLRSHFVGLLRARLAPAVIAGCAARALVERGYHVELWGENWPAIAIPSGDRKGGPTATADESAAGARIPSRTDPRRGPIPAGARLNELFNATDLVLLPNSHELAVQTALDSLAAGVRVIIMSDAESFSKQHPGLEELLPHLCFYRTRRELVSTVSRLLLSEEKWRKQAPAVRKLIQSNHSVATRLTSIAERLRTIRTA